MFAVILATCCTESRSQHNDPRPPDYSLQAQELKRAQFAAGGCPGCLRPRLTESRANSAALFSAQLSGVILSAKARISRPHLVRAPAAYGWSARRPWRGHSCRPFRGHSCPLAAQTSSSPTCRKARRLESRRNGRLKVCARAGRRATEFYFITVTVGEVPQFPAAS